MYIHEESIIVCSKCGKVPSQCHCYDGVIPATIVQKYPGGPLEVLDLVPVESAPKAKGVEGEVLDQEAASKERYPRLEFTPVSVAVRESHPTDLTKEEFINGDFMLGYEATFKGPKEEPGFVQPPGAGITIVMTGPGSGGELFWNTEGVKYKITIEQVPPTVDDYKLGRYLPPK